MYVYMYVCANKCVSKLSVLNSPSNVESEYVSFR